MPLLTEPAAPPAPPAPPPPPENHTPQPPIGPGPRRTPGARLGILLVVVGIILLLAQLLPGLAWWNMWPLVIVIAGAVQAFTPGREGWNVHRLFDGFSTAAFGLVLLAITTGFVGLDVIWHFISLWPVLLIALGLELLGRSIRQPWVRAMGSLLVILALGASVAAASGTFALPSVSFVSGAAARTTDLSEPLALGVNESTLKLDAGAGNITLSGGSGELVQAKVQSPWGTPTLKAEQNGSRANVLLTMSGADKGVVWPGGVVAFLDAQLSPSVLWDITANVGASDFKADLRGVPVRSIVLKPGVSDAKLQLGPVPSGVVESRATIKAGVSSIALKLPAGVPVRIESKSAISSTNISPAYRSHGSGVWESADFEQARAAGNGVWIVTIESAIGSVNISSY